MKPGPTDPAYPDPPLQPLIDPTPPPPGQYRVWMRRDHKRWKRVGPEFVWHDEAMDYAVDCVPPQREWVVLPEGEDPHRGFSQK